MSGAKIDIRIVRRIWPQVAHATQNKIENTRERLRALYGARGSLEITQRPEGGTIAVLRLPYREVRGEPNGETS